MGCGATVPSANRAGGVLPDRVIRRCHRLSLGHSNSPYARRARESSNTWHTRGLLEGMDQTDRQLIIMLAASPRIPVQELARKLGISRQAVHHRMRMLAEAGVYKGTTAAVSIQYLHAIPVVVFGRSAATSVQPILVNLGKSNLTRRVLIAGGNFVYAVGWLRDLSELEGYAAFVGQAATMREPTVGIYSLDSRLMPEFTVDGIGKRRESQRELTSLDLRIVAALANDARRPVADVAADLGVSNKTVRRHLDTMMANGQLELHALTDEPAGGQMLFLVHIGLRDGADKVVVAHRLLLKYPFWDAYVRAFTNLPNLLIWVFWTRELTAVRDALAGLEDDGDVTGAVPNFTFLERIYRTWRETPSAVEPLLNRTTRDRRALRELIPR